MTPFCSRKILKVVIIHTSSQPPNKDNVNWLKKIACNQSKPASINLMVNLISSLPCEDSRFMDITNSWSNEIFDKVSDMLTQVSSRSLKKQSYKEIIGTLKSFAKEPLANVWIIQFENTCKWNICKVRNNTCNACSSSSLTSEGFRISSVEEDGGLGRGSPSSSYWWGQSRVWYTCWASLSSSGVGTSR